jgi:hypothetical protein
MATDVTADGGSDETVRIMADQGVLTSQLFPVAGGETM